MYDYICTECSAAIGQPCETGCPVQDKDFDDFDDLSDGYPDGYYIWDDTNA